MHNGQERLRIERLGGDEDSSLWFDLLAESAFAWLSRLTGVNVHVAQAVPE